MENKENRRMMRRDGKFYDSIVNVRIRERMEELGWSAADLQRALKDHGLVITGEAVRQWVSGYSQPKLDNIPVIADTLDCSINYLFGGTDIRTLTAESITVSDLDFPESAIAQLAGRHTVSKAYEEKGEEDNTSLKVKQAYDLFIHMIGKPGFWTALDYLHNYIAANVSDWKTAKIDLPDGAGTVEMDASHIRDSLWADCTKPLREVIDRTMVKPRVEEIEGKTKSAPGADNTGDGHQEQKL